MCDLAPIAKKYEVEEVVDAIVDRLSRCFPSNKLEEWDPSLGQNLPVPPCLLENNDAVAVVVIARILDVPRLLPTAFYNCVLVFDAGELLAASETESGDAPDLLLSRKDLGICLSGYEDLLKQRKCMIKMFAEFAGDANCRSDQCKTSSRCHTAADKLLFRLLENDTYNTAPAVIDPMDSWFEKSYQETPQAKLCRGCDKVLRGKVKKMQLEVWERLGSIFQVKPWPVTGEEDDGEGEQRNEAPENQASVHQHHIHGGTN